MSFIELQWRIVWVACFIFEQSLVWAVGGKDNFSSGIWSQVKFGRAVCLNLGSPGQLSSSILNSCFEHGVGVWKCGSSTLSFAQLRPSGSPPGVPVHNQMYQNPVQNQVFQNQGLQNPGPMQPTHLDFSGGMQLGCPYI